MSKSKNMNGPSLDEIKVQKIIFKIITLLKGYRILRAQSILEEAKDYVASAHNVDPTSKSFKALLKEFQKSWTSPR